MNSHCLDVLCERFGVARDFLDRGQVKNAIRLGLFESLVGYTYIGRRWRVAVLEKIIRIESAYVRWGRLRRSGGAGHTLPAAYGGTGFGACPEVQTSDFISRLFISFFKVIARSDKDFFFTFTYSQAKGEALRGWES